MFVSIRLDGTHHEPGQLQQSKLPHPEVSAFLTGHPTAKIIVIVDTHSIQETGTFLWNGTRAEDYESCSLFAVSIS